MSEPVSIFILLTNVGDSFPKYVKQKMKTVSSLVKHIAENHDFRITWTPMYYLKKKVSLTLK